MSSLCISDWFWEALPVFPRNSQKQCWHFIFRKKRKLGRTFLLFKKSHIAIIEVCHMTGLLAWFTCQSQSMDRQTTYWKGRGRGGGRSRHADAKTSTWNYLQGLQCLLFNVLNSRKTFPHSSSFLPQLYVIMYFCSFTSVIKIWVKLWACHCTIK